MNKKTLLTAAVAGVVAASMNLAKTSVAFADNHEEAHKDHAADKAECSAKGKCGAAKNKKGKKPGKAADTHAAPAHDEAHKSH